MLKIDLESGGGAIIAHLSGELDRSAREPLLKAVRAEAEAKGGKVVLDCGNLSALDSEGVRALLALQTWLRIKDSEMVIAALPPKLEETIKSDSGVDQFLLRHPTVPRALQALGLEGPAPQSAASSPSTAPPPPPSAATASPPQSAPPAGAPEPPGGGWGPPLTPPPAASGSTGAAPTQDSRPPSGASAAAPGPWETPIETPPTSVGPGGSPPPPAAEEPPAEPPPGAWGTPATPPPAAPGTETPAPTPWAKGPPPRPESHAARKRKGPLVAAGLGALALIILLAWFFFRPGEPDVQPASLRPQEYVIRGLVGEDPSRDEAVFSLAHVALDSVRTSPLVLPPWVTLKVDGTPAAAEVILGFETITEMPSGELERGFHVEATGLDGQELAGLVHFQIREPNILTFEEQTLRSGQAGERYTDYIQVKGEGATFTTDPASLPPGIELTAEGKLTGTPAEPGEYSFEVTATRPGDEPGTKTYRLSIAPAQPAESDSEDVAELIRMILERIGNLDIASMSTDVRRQYERLVAYLPQILADPANHVKPAVTVTFPVGRVALDEAEVITQLEDPALKDWLANRDTQMIIAGFADTSGDPTRNHSLIELRAGNLETVIEDWLVKVYRESRADAEERVTVVPNKPSDVFQKSRAAECWLFRPPGG